MESKDIQIEVYHSIADIGPEKWSEYVSKRFFLSYNYLHTLEQACTQLNYRYSIYFENGKFQGLSYFQIIPILGENLLEYIPQTNSILKFLFKKIISPIRTDLLVLGNVIFTCENGVLISPEATTSPEDIVKNTFDEVLKSLSKKPLGSMISENIKGLSSNIYCKNNFHEFKVEDRMEIDLKRFSSFVSYESELQSKYRVRMHKVFKLNESVEKINIDAENFAIYRGEMEKLFLSVLDHSKFKLTTISIDYFYHFVKNVPRFHLIGYLVQGRLIGFISYFQLDSIIEVHYIGLDYEYNHTNKIYNFILYSMIQLSFELEIKTICFGRTAQELKSTLGAVPYSISSSLKLNNAILNYSTPFFLNRMTPNEWVQRHPFKN